MSWPRSRGLPFQLARAPIRRILAISVSALPFVTINSESFVPSLAQNSRTLTGTSLSMKLGSPSADRNKGPIWDVLAGTVLEKLRGEDLQILEVAAGSGVHTAHFCAKLQERGMTSSKWYPSDPEAASLASIQAYKMENSLEICQDPIQLTLDEHGISEPEVNEALPKELDLILCINMIHITPWDATIGLIKLARDKLRQGGVLFCYGPYKVGGTAVQSNLNFDKSLRQRNPEWGVRDLEHVVDLAEYYGISRIEQVDMPANNLACIYQKR